MGEWQMQIDVSVVEIPATAGTHKSDPYYIGLFKNGELNTTEAISEFEITKPDWVKEASFGNKSLYGDYYPLTYKVDENTETSPRSGIITVKYGPANKSLAYPIKQSANTTQEPTEPTLNEYVFQITKYNGHPNYPLQVRGYRADPNNNVSFATIKANDINDTSLNIDIKIDLSATNSLDELNFNFTIIGKGFEFDSSIKQNGGTARWKSVYIMLGGERKGFLKVERSDNGGLKIRITIFPNNQNPKALALLSEDISTGVLSDSIEGTITINSHDIRFKVTLGFGALQQ